MSKELEALKDLREDAKHHLNHHIDYLNERLDIIETALKEYKELKKIVKQQIKTTTYYENLALKNKIENDKKLKALEIIKENLSQEEKQVLLNIIYTYAKNEEEYDLVKEVLL